MFLRENDITKTFFNIKYLIIFICNNQNYTLRNTNYGQVRGYRFPFQFKAETGMNLEVFLGIPYAAPPVAGRRWRRPVEPKPWEGIYNATDFSACCSQPMHKIRE